MKIIEPSSQAFEPLDSYEKELIKDIENNQFKSIPNVKKEIEKYASYSTDQKKKDKRVTLRIPQSVLSCIQSRAIEGGIPYQTLIAALLHQYAEGKIKLSL